METGRFIFYIKVEDIYMNIAKDVEMRFDTSNCELEISLPMGKNKNVIGPMKYELEGKKVTEFVVLILKTYSYLTGDNDENK